MIAVTGATATAWSARRRTRCRAPAARTAAALGPDHDEVLTDLDDDLVARGGDDVGLVADG